MSDDTQHNDPLAKAIASMPPTPELDAGDRTRNRRAKAQQSLQSLVRKTSADLHVACQESPALAAHETDIVRQQKAGWDLLCLHNTADWDSLMASGKIIPFSREYVESRAPVYAGIVAALKSGIAYTEICKIFNISLSVLHAIYAREAPAIDGATRDRRVDADRFLFAARSALNKLLDRLESDKELSIREQMSIVSTCVNAAGLLCAIGASETSTEARAKLATHKMPSVPGQGRASVSVISHEEVQRYFRRVVESPTPEPESQPVAPVPPPVIEG